MHVKKEFVIHIWISKQALNHELILKKVHRVIKSNQEAFLKPYIDMNTEKKNGKKIEKDFCELVNNAVFGKTLENWENIETSSL